MVIDEVTKEIEREVLWCMMFANNIFLVGENLDEVNNTQVGRVEVSP